MELKITIKEMFKISFNMTDEDADKMEKIYILSVKAKNNKKYKVWKKNKERCRKLLKKYNYNLDDILNQ